MRDRSNKYILAHQGHYQQKVETKESSKNQPSEPITEEQKQPKPLSNINTTIEVQSEPVTKITNSSPVNAVTIAGEVIFFSLIITPIALTWIKSRVTDTQS